MTTKEVNLTDDQRADMRKRFGIDTTLTRGHMSRITVEGMFHALLVAEAKLHELAAGTVRASTIRRLQEAAKNADHAQEAFRAAKQQESDAVAADRVAEKAQEDAERELAALAEQVSE